MIRLIAALGNPGARYSSTRHNIGWMVLDKYLEDKNCLWRQKFHGLYAKIPSPQLHCIKPQTFMNLSGRSAAAAAAFFSVPPEDILVIHDDTELPFGDVLLRKGGGLRGHKGLRSLKQHLRSDAFVRLSIGIGRPSDGDLSSFVTAGFSEFEQPILPQLLRSCADLIDETVRGGSDWGRRNIFPDHQ